MTRDDIGVWTWRLGQWHLEFVTVFHRLRTVALWADHGRKWVARLEMR